MHAPIKVTTGSIVTLRLYDVAYSIDLAKVESLWTARRQRVASRSRLNTTPAHAVAFDVPPVALSLDPVELDIGGARLSIEAGVRIYDFGVICLSLTLPVADCAWNEFTELLNALDAAVKSDAGRRVCDEQLSAVRDLMSPAFTKPSNARIQEDYLLGVVQGWSEPLQAAELLERVDLAGVLSGERRTLSEGARRDLLRHRFSYYTDDMVVLTWDRAFVWEPRADSDVPDVLEIANAQLLELRYYDELLDDELPRIYDLVEETQRTLNFLNSLVAPRRLALLARRLYTLVAEVTELTEKVDNALQVIEDVYLARVYTAALEQFRVPLVSAAVDRKLSIIRDTYTALYDESSSARSYLLEIAIVILIVIEVMLALVRY